jgi:DNA-nicking Smr family endonuclease
MSRDGSRRRVLSYEERVLWTTVTKAITPLRDMTPEASEAAGAAGVVISEVRKPLRPAPKTPKTVKSGKPSTVVPYMPPQQMPPQPKLAPLGRRMKQRLARGKEAIDARLDLHGLTQAQAHAALLRFLRAASARDVCLVLVITGKGARGDGESGVLRRHVPQWLGLPEFRPFVVGFEDAHIAHGGEGALYVRVRRGR